MKIFEGDLTTEIQLLTLKKGEIDNCNTMITEESDQICNELQMVKDKNILLNDKINGIEGDVFQTRNNLENELDINKDLRTDELELSM